MRQRLLRADGNSVILRFGLRQLRGRLVRAGRSSGSQLCNGLWQLWRRRVRRVRSADDVRRRLRDPCGALRGRRVFDW